MTWHFQSINLPNPSLFRFLRFWVYPSNFSCFSKALEACKVGPLGRITAGQKISKSIFAKNITSNDWLRLPERQPFQSSSFSIFGLPFKFLFFSNALEASKVSASEGITTEQKISKSVFAKNIFSNDLFRIPGSQPTQSSSFSNFEIFDLPVKIFMPQ